MGMIDSKAMLQTSKKISGGCEERAVDMNVVLPDYYPPIAAVLKCLMVPCISSRFQSSDRYSIDGITTVRLLYVSEDRQAVYCYEATQPFNVSFRCDQAIHHYTSLKVDYVNCRATAERRVDIHGAFRVCFEGIGLAEASVIADSDQEGLCCKKLPITYTVPVGETEKIITVDETVDVGARVDRMLYSEMQVLSSECKVLPNKLIVKGVVRVKALCAQEEQICPIVQDVPFSQILDVEGMSEQWQAALEIMQSENETYLQQSEGGNALLFINGKIIVCARLMADKTETVILDAYHRKHPTLCETVPFYAVHQTSPRILTSTMTQTVSRPEQATSLLDVWGDLKSYECREDDGCMSVSGCVAVCMIAHGEDNHPCYYERTVDFLFHPETNGTVVGVQLADLHVDVLREELRVCTELVLECIDMTSHSLHAVCDITVDESNDFENSDATLRIVYAERDQSVWDIAKQHHARVEDIVEENSLSSEIISEPMMLMIPLG